MSYDHCVTAAAERHLCYTRKCRMAKRLNIESSGSIKQKVAELIGLVGRLNGGGGGVEAGSGSVRLDAAGSALYCMGSTGPEPIYNVPAAAVSGWMG